MRNSVKNKYVSLGNRKDPKEHGILEYKLKPGTDVDLKIALTGQIGDLVQHLDKFTEDFLLATITQRLLSD